jgi:arginyl-tRNA synthetase
VLHKILEQKLQQASRLYCLTPAPAVILVRPCPDPKFGDYQTNALMALAKARKMNPRQLAAQVAAKLDLAQWCEPVEVAGAGFLNFRLKPSAFAQALREAASGRHLFFQKTSEPRGVIIDFSSPNVAKPMHVGHIRSTILGDAWRVFSDCSAITSSPTTTYRRLGHAIRQIAGGLEVAPGPRAIAGGPHRRNGAPLQTGQRAVRERSSSFGKARQELVKLQAGDEENLRLWKEMIALSQTQFDRVYARIGREIRSHVRGKLLQSNAQKSGR